MIPKEIKPVDLLIKVEIEEWKVLVFIRANDSVVLFQESLPFIA